MFLIKLIVETHEAAKNKGWWDKERDQREVLMLVISELSEAVEAVRINKRAQMEEYLTALPTQSFADAFKTYLKDSLEDEIADAFIRLCDFAGRYCTRFDNIENYYEQELSELSNLKIGSIAGYLFGVTRTVQDVHYSSFKTQNIGEALGKLMALSIAMNFNLLQHIDLKIKYNALREHKHGKLF